MRQVTLREQLNRSPAEVFDFMVVHQPENHPLWEKEVVEIRREPLRLGAKGIMVRQEWGKTEEAPFEVVELQTNRRVAYRSGRGGFHLHLVFTFEPKGGGTELVVQSTLRLSGWLRLMWPMMWFVFPVRSARITRAFATLINGQRGGAMSPSAAAT